GAATSTEEVVAARREAVAKALARPASVAEMTEYLQPWTDPRVARSWLALAGAADNRYTLELLPKLRQSNTPKLLAWGEDDQFQTMDDVGGFGSEFPARRLVRIKAAGNIQMETNPRAVARALAEFFGGI